MISIHSFKERIGLFFKKIKKFLETFTGFRIEYAYEAFNAFAGVCEKFDKDAERGRL